MSKFHFKYFTIEQSNSAMKVGTDAMLLGAFIKAENKKVGLDIGSGTGVISLMIAQKNERIEIDAIEIDEISSNECRQNFKNSLWSNRLKVVECDFKSFTSLKKYDLIFSNPPYYSSTNLNEDIRKAKARHEESLPSKIILKKVNDLLSDSGDFWLIVPFSEKDKWIEKARLNQLLPKENITIKGKQNSSVNRVILCFSKVVDETIMQSFTVRKNNGDYSDEYITLTKDFHAKDLQKKNS